MWLIGQVCFFVWNNLNTRRNIGNNLRVIRKRWKTCWVHLTAVQSSAWSFHRRWAQLSCISPATVAEYVTNVTSVYGTSMCVQSLSIINKATKNITLQVFLWHVFSFLVGMHVAVYTSWVMLGMCLTVLEIARVFRSGYTTLYFCQ
jgi:hypothetical protein